MIEWIVGAAIVGLFGAGAATPRGYRWVQSDNDAVLVSIAGGSRARSSPTCSAEQLVSAPARQGRGTLTTISAVALSHAPDGKICAAISLSSMVKDARPWWPRRKPASAARAITVCLGGGADPIEVVKIPDRAAKFPDAHQSLEPVPTKTRSIDTITCYICEVALSHNAGHRLQHRSCRSFKASGSRGLCRRPVRFASFVQPTHS